MSDQPTASVFQHRPYTCFWFSRILSTVTFQMQGVAVGWQMYSLTHSTFMLGIVGLMQFLPLVLLTLVVGHVADRYNRQAVIAIAQVVQGVALLLLAFGSMQHWLTPPTILVAVAIIGAGRAFERPAIQAIVPSLVPNTLVHQAIAWAASANETAVILGPAIGGLLYVMGPTAPYMTAGVLILLASCFSSLIRVERRVVAGQPAGASSLFSGIHFIREHKVVLGCISLDLFAVLLGGATALLPVYARDILHTGPWGLGILRSAPAVGALIMSFVLGRKPLRRRVGRVMFAAVIVFGVATMVFAVSRSIALSLCALAVLGAADVVSVVIRSSFVQLETPDAMRGRVSAVNSLFIGTSNQLGEFESGVTASLLGTVPATLLGGVGTVAVALLWMWLFPALRDADTVRPQA